MARVPIKINEKYYPAFESKARYKILYGGRGGGRSYFGVQYFLVHIRQSKYFRGYFMRELFSDIRESLFRGFIDLIESLEIEDEFHILDNTMVITHKETGNMIISKGFKKASGKSTGKLKSITDATHVLIEEADEIQQDEFNKLDDSLRTVKREHVEIMMLLNPENEESWINRHFFIDNKPKKDPNIKIIHTTYKDNINNLQQSFVDKLEGYSRTHPEYYKVFTLGLWGGGVKGRVFDNWQQIEEMPDLYSSFGLDFGFTNDPATIVEVAKHNQKIYVDEVFYELGLTNDMIKLHFLNGRPDRNPKIARIYADSAEPKSIAELKNESLIEATETLQATFSSCDKYIVEMKEKGLKKAYYRLPGLNVIPATKGTDSIRAGINFLKEHEVFVTSRSKNIWTENKYYKWHQDSEGNFTNKPVDDFNHAKDAIRYNIYTQYAKPKRFIRKKTYSSL